MMERIIITGSGGVFGNHGWSKCNLFGKSLPKTDLHHIAPCNSLDIFETDAWLMHPATQTLIRYSPEDSFVFASCQTASLSSRQMFTYLFILSFTG